MTTKTSPSVPAPTESSNRREGGAGRPSSSKMTTLASHLSKANSVASDSLRRTLARHRRAATDAGGDGGDDDGDRRRRRREGGGAKDDGEGLVIDYLRAKNSMTASYLVDLALLLRHRLQSSSSSSPPTEEGRRRERQRRQRRRRECLDRLLEMKVALERMRPLERKMRYQIDKLLALSTLGAMGGAGSAGTFASVGREIEEEEEKADDEEEMETIKKGTTTGDGGDPLSFKPDLQGMMKMFEEEDGNDGVSSEGERYPGFDSFIVHRHSTNSCLCIIRIECTHMPSHPQIYSTQNNKLNQANDANSKYDGSDDDEEGGAKPSSYKARVALERDDNEPINFGNNNNVYQPPRLQSMPFDPDDNDRAMEKRRRQLEKQRDRLSRSELTAVVRSQFTDAPEEEDARGGALLGMQSESARRIAARDADVREFEEGQMIRLSMGKKERGERKRMMREEMSNLGAIAGGLGGLMAGVEDAFGGGGGKRRSQGEARDGDDGAGGGEFKTTGMRKRRVEVLEGGDGAGKKKKKKGGPTNTYQKSLYGGGGGGAGSGGGGAKKRR